MNVDWWVYLLESFATKNGLGEQYRVYLIKNREKFELVRVTRNILIQPKTLSYTPKPEGIVGISMDTIRCVVNNEHNQNLT